MLAWGTVDPRVGIQVEQMKVVASSNFTKNRMHWEQSLCHLTIELLFCNLLRVGFLLKTNWKLQLIQNAAGHMLTG